MNQKILIVYNTCGLDCGTDHNIKNRDNTDWYIECIQSLLDQKYDNQHVVWSSCFNKPEHRAKLKNHFGSRISYNFIDTVAISVFGTFNHSVKRCEEHISQFDAYFYIDSGVKFQRPDIVLETNKLLANKDNAIICLTADTDNGFSDFPQLPQSFPFEDHYIMPVGTYLRAHTTCYARCLLDTYGVPAPDIFASFFTEAPHTYMAAGLGKNVIIHKDAFTLHRVGSQAVDGASLGFPNLPTTNPRPRWDHTLGNKNMIDIISDPEAWECGFGYEIYSPETGAGAGIEHFPHNPECWENNKCKDPERLKRFLIDNIFLKPEEVDYNSLPNEFIPGDCI